MADGPWSNPAQSLIVIVAGGGFTGLFVYSGPPALGNLIASIAAQGGSDPYGNGYGSGIEVYGGNTPGSLRAVLLAGKLLLDAIGSATTAAPNVATDSTGTDLILSSSTKSGQGPAVLTLVPGVIPQAGLNAPLSLAGEASAPAAVAAAANLYADANGQPAAVNPAGFAGHLVMAPLAQVSGVTITAASFTTCGDFTIPAGDMEVGAVYEITYKGQGVWGSTQQTLIFQVAIDGANVSTTAGIAGADFAASATFSWSCRVLLICGTAGAAGRVQVHMAGCITQNDHVITPGTAANNTVPWEGTSKADVAVDTTASHTLALQAEWASTTGAPTITARNSWIQRIA
ncbi:MAG TPA: hypothetical protein VIX86_04600 [Streptosporangiaceae bacterium]